MSELSDAASLLNAAATKANNTTDFFDKVTTLDETSSVKNPNNGITVPSVQKQIQDLYSESETDINNAVDRAEVAADIAESAPILPAPDVYISFNDGVEIERGFGSRNAYGNKSVDFSRLSGSTVINKSSILETLLDDESAISNNGVEIYNTYTNSVLYSTDASQWTYSGTSSYTTDGTLSQDNTTEMALLSVSAGEFVTPAVQSLSQLTGEKVCFSSEIRKANTDTVQFLAGLTGGASIIPTATFSFSAEGFISSGAAYSTSVKKISKDHFRVYICITDNNTGNNYAMFRVLWGFASDLYVSNIGVYVGVEFEMPSIKTNGTAETHAAETASIPNENNLPAVGNSFTDSFDVVWNGLESFIGETETRGYGIYITDIGDVYLRGETNQGLICSGLIANEKTNITVTYDGATCTGFVNGVVSESTTLPDITYSFDKSFFFGRNYTADIYLNSTLSEFKRWFFVLSDNHIKSNGAE